MRRWDQPVIDDTDSGSDVSAQSRTAADGLAKRLAALDSRHPSAPDQPSRLSDRPGRLTAEERDEHSDELREGLSEARAASLATDHRYTTDDERKLWTAERLALQEQILHELYTEADKVPCEGKAILAGGLPGSGKTTVLTEHAGIDLDNYLMINPDKIKEVMAARGMVPELAGLSPMEASDLVHEESSQIARRLARLAYADGKNVIWDITMSSPDSAASRIVDLRAAGYQHVEGIFVDIPVEVSVRRAEARYWEGHEDYLAGKGFGGRYVPPELIRAQADPEFGSQNRRTFELIKPKFDAWRLFDNSADGEPAVLVASGPRREDLTEEEA